MSEQKIQTEDQILGEWVYCSQHLRPHQSGWCTVSLEDKVGLGPFTGASDVQNQKATEKCRHLGLKIGGSAALEDGPNMTWWKANKAKFEKKLKGRYILISNRGIVASNVSIEPLRERSAKMKEYIIVNNGATEMEKGHRVGFRWSHKGKSK